jgi:hypothetical protein
MYSRAVRTGVNDVFVGIKSAPTEKYRSRRQLWRQSCSSRYKAEGVKYAFFVGVPLSEGHDLTGHNQGGHDTPEERRNEELLRGEADRFTDIRILPMRDSYEDLTDKLIGLLSYSYDSTSASYVVEHDDEFCIDVNVLLNMISTHEARNSSQELYGGNYRFAGTEYDSMRGVNGMTSPFFSGNAVLLSRGLVKTIIDTDYTNTVLAGTYGTTADDANLGRWVQYAERKHNMTINVLSDGGLVKKVVPDGML